MTESEVERRWINVGDIEIREDQSRRSPGRIVGTILEYGKRAVDRAETFADGALSWPDNGVILNIQHDRRQPVIRTIPKVEGSRVTIDEALPDTSRGRDVATMVRNGTLGGLSVEFAAKEDRYVGGVREIRSALLTAIGVVDAGSYDTAVAVRSRSNVRRRRPWY